MKRFWLILLSLGLVMAFSVSAFAVDVKVSAEYYAAGLYLNKTSVHDAYTIPSEVSINVPEGPSTAFFFQRLRVGTDFIVSPCLKLVTRFDAMERIWGGQRSDPGIGGFNYDPQSAGTRAENENIAFDLAYIDYTSPIGLFRVGYQKDYEWGTIFDNRTTGPTAGIITYAVPVGPVTILAQYAKETDKSASAVTYPVTTTDQDYDSYRLGAIFKFGTDKAKGEAGLLGLFNRIAEYKDGTVLGIPLLAQVYKAIPYFKAQIGPVALQGEFEYTFGNAKLENGISIPGIGSQINIEAWSAFLDATAAFGPVYVGGSFAYLSGDDPGSHDKLEGGTFPGTSLGINTAGLDWNPCLIMFNTETTAYWVGPLGGYNDSVVDSEMSNAYFFQGRVGVKPIPQLDVLLSASYATADKKPAGFANGTYGTEIDLTGTYKITNNLSYMLGAGYLFTGDYFKGYDDGSSNKVNDDFILINKLTLTF